MPEKRTAEQTTEPAIKKAHTDDQENIDSELLEQGFVDAQDGEENTEANAESTPQNGDENDSSEKQTDSLKQILHAAGEKPLAGTQEWHKMKKENHKEVERRRRETINAGIKELAALLPNQETNKAQIIQRAIEYIKRLKDSEKNNVEKWTLEKLLNEQALHELTATNEKLKVELEKAYRDVEHWKKIVSIAKTNE